MSFQSPLELRSVEGHNLLHEMVNQGKTGMLQIILGLGWWEDLSTDKIPENSSSEYPGCTPLEIVQRKNVSEVKQQLEEIQKRYDSLTPLIRACINNDVATVRSILQSSSSAQDLQSVDIYAWNSLFWSVPAGNYKIVEILIKAGVNINAVSKYGSTLLHIACVYGCTKLVNILRTNKQYYFEPYKENCYGTSAYDDVAINGDVQTFEELLKHGYEPKPNFFVLTSFYGRKICVEYCLNKLKMDINGVDKFGRTALYRAVVGKEEDIVK